MPLAASARRWLPCNLSDPAQISALPRGIGAPIDALLFTGGVWENGAFTDACRFEASPAAEAANLLAVILLAPILLADLLRAFDFALSLSPAPVAGLCRARTHSGSGLLQIANHQPAASPSPAS